MAVTLAFSQVNASFRAVIWVLMKTVVVVIMVA